MRRIKTIAIALAAAMLPLSGCGNKDVTEDTSVSQEVYAYDGISYTDESELPEDAFYIVHETASGTVYYPLASAETTFESANGGPTGYDPSRIEWYLVSEENYIPTMYVGDSVIYKSGTYIPLEYSLEKFFDEGYTFGVSGLAQDSSGNYKYTSTSCSLLSNSTAAGLSTLETEDVQSIYFVSAEDSSGDATVLSGENISLSGTVKGLTCGETYTCDIRTGTEKVTGTITCDTHYYSSAETYLFSS